MNILHVVWRNRLILVWFGFLLITLLASVIVVNPTMNPNSGRLLSFSQLELQFAYIPENGMRVLESWGPGAQGRYLSVIWIDILFALSYGPFFYMLIRRLGGAPIWSIVPLAEMGTNLTETTLEIYWVVHHTETNPMLAVFLVHSIIATIKWFILVPIYLVHSAVLIYRCVRRPETLSSAHDGSTEIEQSIRTMLAEQFNIPASEITMSMSLSDDLGADSGSLVEMVVRLEDRFDMRLPDSAFTTRMKVGDLARLISIGSPRVGG